MIILIGTVCLAIWIYYKIVVYLHKKRHSEKKKVYYVLKLFMVTVCTICLLVNTLYCRVLYDEESLRTPYSEEQIRIARSTLITSSLKYDYLYYPLKITVTNVDAQGCVWFITRYSLSSYLYVISPNGEISREKKVVSRLYIE